MIILSVVAYLIAYLAVAFVSAVCFSILFKEDKRLMAMLGLIWPLSVPIFTFLILGRIIVELFVK